MYAIFLIFALITAISMLPGISAISILCLLNCMAFGWVLLWLNAKAKQQDTVSGLQERLNKLIS